MYINLKPYLQEIDNLNPLIDSGFTYNTNVWRNLENNYKHHLIGFENKTISRKNVIDSFIDFFNNTTNWEKPFLFTMVWGFGNTGYGSFRTNKYLHTKNHNKINDAFILIKEKNIEQAFLLLISIDGLSISYISKLLYFATRALLFDNYCLIFDIRVARSLVRITSGNEIFNLLQINPSNKYKDYKNYNSYIHQIAKYYKVEAEKIEQFLFDFDKKNNNP